jgi:oxygen-independent coproporphyrinogen-3 oxidase
VAEQPMNRIAEREKGSSRESRPPRTSQASGASRRSQSHQEPSRAKQDTTTFFRPKTVGIYIQVPFCQTKCTYCNFHTGVASPAAYAPYARAVESEIRNWRALHAAAGLGSATRLDPIEHSITGVIEREKGLGVKPFFAHKEVDSIYLGGGTPSLFDPADLARILDAVRSQFTEVEATAPSSRASAASTEVTLEADPETISPEKAAAWLAAGINRISLGAQSFHDAELKPAGRMHRRDDIFSAIAHLRAEGFANVSLDLIAGLPHQTAASWQASVEEALRLRPEHISIYLFEVDEGSRLGRELLVGGARYSASAVPSDDAMAESYEFACARLCEAGYDHYEISNWALPGFRSRHNLKYWRREPYLGFGAGAHSFDGRWRWANAHDPAAYAAAINQGRLPLEQLEEITPRQALDEELFLGLRQLEGIDLAAIKAHYGSLFNTAIDARIEELRAQGLVERDGTRVRLAPARLAVSNEVFVALLD